MASQTDPALVERLKARIRTFRYECPCGTSGNVIQLDKNGRPWTICKNFSCKRLLFWSRPEKLLEPDLFCRHAPPLRPTKKKGIQTSYCPICRIRVFERAAVQ